MSYGAAGPCPDFVLRPKKCKITAKIGKKTEKKSWAVKLYHGLIFENLVKFFFNNVNVI
jgi:hypothetical protein